MNELRINPENTEITRVYIGYSKETKYKWVDQEIRPLFRKGLLGKISTKLNLHKVIPSGYYYNGDNDIDNSETFFSNFSDQHIIVENNNVRTRPFITIYYGSIIMKGESSFTVKFDSDDKLYEYMKKHKIYNFKSFSYE